MGRFTTVSTGSFHWNFGRKNFDGKELENIEKGEEAQEWQREKAGKNRCYWSET